MCISQVFFIDWMLSIAPVLKVLGSVILEIVSGQPSPVPWSRKGYGPGGATLPMDSGNSGRDDRLRAWLNQLADMNHGLANFSRPVNWAFFTRKFDPAGANVLHHPPLLKRPMTA